WLFAICVGALVGGLLQFLIQLPLVWRLSSTLRVSLSTRVPGVRDALTAFGPAVAGRGVVQISLYLDNILASLLAVGAVGAIANAAVLINLPLGVFGMAVAIAELPELSRADPTKARRAIADRIARAVRQSAFLVCPSVVGYLAFGWLIVGLFFRGGQFDLASQWLVWVVLAGYSLGLLASTSTRILQNAFFALRDTRTPAWIASARLVASASVGYLLMTRFDRWAVADLVPAVERPDLYFGAVGLALGSSVGAWAELGLLAWALRRRLPELRLPVVVIAGRLALAVGVALPALALWWALADASLLVGAAVVLPSYAVAYLGIAAWRGFPEIEMWVGKVARRIGR
ncbi:MAG: lipid II flippase MurJ, partial [Acidobacteriota bacterium]